MVNSHNYNCFYLILIKRSISIFFICKGRKKQEKLEKCCFSILAIINNNKIGVGNNYLPIVMGLFYITYNNINILIFIIFLVIDNICLNLLYK